MIICDHILPFNKAEALYFNVFSVCKVYISIVEKGDTICRQYKVEVDQEEYKLLD